MVAKRQTVSFMVLSVLLTPFVMMIGGVVIYIIGMRDVKPPR